MGKIMYINVTEVLVCPLLSSVVSAVFIFCLHVLIKHTNIKSKYSFVDSCPTIVYKKWHVSLQRFFYNVDPSLLWVLWILLCESETKCSCLVLQMLVIYCNDT